MSGSRRSVPMEKILNSTRVFLIVDPSTLKRTTRTTTIPIPDKKSQRPSYDFKHQVISAKIIEILLDESETITKAKKVRVLSVSDQRSRYWNYRVAFDGARKIMYYDENEEFDRKVDGPRALLLLKNHDAALDVWDASMGEGLLPISHLESIREHIGAR